MTMHTIAEETNRQKQIRYFKPSEVAKMFGVDRLTVYVWIKRGQLTARKINKRFYIDENSVNAIIKGS
jgi:excisionase family DNA binding protein